MRVRHENGCTIITDVYEPSELPPPMPRTLIALGFLAGIAIACGALIGLAGAW